MAKPYRRRGWVWTGREAKLVEFKAERTDCGGRSMRIKLCSWILAAAYFIFGLVIFLMVSRFAAMFANLGVTLPGITGAIYAVGATGWLVASFFGAIIVVLKDLKFQSTLLNPIFTLALIV